METLKRLMFGTVAMCVLALASVNVAPAAAANGEADMAAFEQKMQWQLLRVVEKVAQTSREVIDPALVSVFDTATGFRYSLGGGLVRAEVMTRDLMPEAKAADAAGASGTLETLASSTLCCYPDGYTYTPYRRITSKPGFSQVLSYRKIPLLCGVDYVEYNEEKQRWDDWNECYDMYHAVQVPSANTVFSQSSPYHRNKWLCDVEVGLHYYWFCTGGEGIGTQCPQMSDRLGRWRIQNTWIDFTEPIADNQVKHTFFPAPPDSQQPIAGTEVRMALTVVWDGYVLHSYEYTGDGLYDYFVDLIYPRDYPYPVPRTDGVGQAMRRTSYLQVVPNDPERDLPEIQWGDTSCDTPIAQPGYGRAHNEVVTNSWLYNLGCIGSLACGRWQTQWTPDKAGPWWNDPDGRTVCSDNPGSDVVLDFVDIQDAIPYYSETLSLRASCNPDRYPTVCDCGSCVSEKKYPNGCPWPYDNLQFCPECP